MTVKLNETTSPQGNKPDPMTPEGQAAIMRRLTAGDGEQTSEPDGAADRLDEDDGA